MIQVTINKRTFDAESWLKLITPGQTESLSDHAARVAAALGLGCVAVLYTEPAYAQISERDIIGMTCNGCGRRGLLECEDDTDSADIPADRFVVTGNRVICGTCYNDRFVKEPAPNVDDPL